MSLFVSYISISFPPISLISCLFPFALMHVSLISLSLSALVCVSLLSLSYIRVLYIHHISLLIPSSLALMGSTRKWMVGLNPSYYSVLKSNIKIFF